ncbi:metal ABC transporter permease [Parasulfitobacter algicola]|uniref:High-affinity zinc uptake system membrane protein ZnuB n=1 Tax=Parasulfitobacter algicola TaxID=2614809 RepID=A0ABX2ING7_9RHOB|nr:metal ABC transporter permease [Sulfitobacter algicola]NSX54408.1 metal ABC transporter permease [Sulfitobacter algicola]
MLDDFIVRATLAGLGIALATAPLGCFIVWRRMAYFGDATAHAAILGVALALAFSISIFATVLIVCVIMGSMVSKLSGTTFTVDTLLGVLAHGSLAFGLVAIAVLGSPQLDPMNYLVGDILSVSKDNLKVIWAGVAIVIGLVVWRWSALLTATLNQDLAFASRINPAQEQLILTLCMAIVVAVSIKIVGALLITAMLIIPAAAARPLSRTPEIMALIAVLIGIVSVFAGLRASYVYNTPTGPSIVCATVIAFVVANVVGSLRNAG